MFKHGNRTFMQEPIHGAPFAEVATNVIHADAAKRSDDPAQNGNIKQVHDAPSVPSKAHEPSSPVSPKGTSDLGKIRKLLGKPKHYVVKGKDIVNFVKGTGILENDPRIVKDMERLRNVEVLSEKSASMLLKHNLIRKCLKGTLAIQHFASFKCIFKELYDEVATNTGGKIADYIPKLANQNPRHWGASVCSTDGQRYSLGDADIPFSAQSASKPITYGLALELHGEDVVHALVGKEPSGRNFNERILLERPGKGAMPHNPYINAGAIMSASMVKMDADEWERFEYVLGIWKKLCGKADVGFQYDTFCGERATASRNFCLAYMMEEEKAFPEGTDLVKTLDAYFSWCSIELTCRSVSVMAATLANGGVCPVTLERIFTHETVTRMLSLMVSCGMYDFSGRFAFEVGFPAKSGVSGIICIVIPGICGMATFSPLLDSMGNSVRGIDFCKKLSERLQYHLFGQLKGLSEETFGSKRASQMIKVEESHKMRLGEEAENEVSSLFWSAGNGDNQRIRQLAVRGIDVNNTDPNQRTALHVAASEGQTQAVRLMLHLNANLNMCDSHGNTPLDDAVREQRTAAKRILQRAADCQAAGLTISRSVREDKSWTAGSVMNYFADMIIKDSVLNADLLPKNVLIDTLGEYGFLVDEDPRLSCPKVLPKSLGNEELEKIAAELPLLPRALRGEIAIPNFCAFSDKAEELFTIMCTEGNSAGYLVGNETFDVMTIDGQRLHLGRSEQNVPLDEIAKMLVYLVADERHRNLSHLVGNEPSGESNESMVVNADGIPFNPFMWNGTLALLALLEESCEDVWQIVTEMWCRLTGQTHAVNDEAWEELDRKKWCNHVGAMVHTLIAEGTLPSETPTEVVVSHFFHLRSLIASTMDLAFMAALFGNGGVNCYTGTRELRASTVKDLLTLMFTSGCDAMSGEFSFRLGVPAKSSAAGIFLMVIPNMAGLCCFGQTVTNNGVSKAGMKLCFEVGDEFNFHALAGNCTKSAKLDPSLYHFQTDIELCDNLLRASSAGDLPSLIYLRNLGFDLNTVDYDMRGGLHVAAAHGQERVLRFLYKSSVDIDVKDRWGNTPIDEAEKNGHTELALKLHKWMIREESKPGSECASSSRASSLRSGKATVRPDRSNAPVAAKNAAVTRRSDGTLPLHQLGSSKDAEEMDSDENSSPLFPSGRPSYKSEVTPSQRTSVAESLEEDKASGPLFAVARGSYASHTSSVPEDLQGQGQEEDPNSRRLFARGQSNHSIASAVPSTRGSVTVVQIAEEVNEDEIETGSV